MDRPWKINIVLTPEQRQLATDNYHLIFSFLHKHKFPQNDENVFLASVGLCKAAYYYQPDKGTFSTVAYFSMYSEFQHFWNYTQKEKRKTAFLTEPVDFTLYDNDDFTLPGVMAFETVNKMSASNTFENDLLCQITYTDFKKTLSDTYLDVLNLLEAGYTPKEISKKLGYLPSNVTYYRNQLKKKYLEFINPKEGLSSWQQDPKQISS